MRIKCEYCDHYIEDTDAYCGHCGAPNANMMRSANGIPKTVEELREFCERHRLPLEQMRFFIGEDYREPRAFGIFQDGDGDFVVYKNKADGSRAIRYEGKDEAYAVNEIYQKLKEEMIRQRQAQRKAQAPPPTKSGGSSNSGKGKAGKGCLIGCAAAIIICVALTIMGMILMRFDPGRFDGGQYGGGSYYSDDYDSGSGGSWLWDDDDSGYNDDSGWSDFWDSWDDDWDDSDWDWDSGSDWDSGGSDWDSDW